MKKGIVLLLVVLISILFCTVVSANMIGSEGIIISINQGMTEEGNPAYIVEVENKFCGKMSGQIELHCYDFSFKANEVMWEIEEENEKSFYPVEYGEHHFINLENVHYCIKLPEQLFEKKAIAKLVLEYKETEYPDSLQIYDVEVDLSGNGSESYYYVIDDATKEHLFGRFANGIVFNCEDGELDIFNNAYSVLSLTENEQMPWNDYCEKIESVRIRNIAELGSQVLDSCVNLKEIYFYRRDIVIAENAISNVNGNEIDIYGYYGSTAEAYAEANGFNFIAFDRSQKGVQGSTDQHIYWSYDEKAKQLRVNGSGEIWDYYGTGALDNYWWTVDVVSRTPWEAFDTQVETLRIYDGVQRIGRYAFTDFVSLKEIYIGETVEIPRNTDGEYADIFSYKIKDNATIKCKAGTEAEKFAFTKGYKFIVDEAVRGDVNEDNKINAQDALEILKMSVKMIDTKYYQGDYNNDYKLNAEDALLVLKQAAGM